ncbi:hypothetical protein [Paenibacillus dokdonensis]|uniref:hypothetical protein n=1 Tax=Paenibacillus dokdonensis TaxID=2567944 RepID=UPI001457E387|nr:hypothetical protein [Paenibacillus dokdonensis]
MLRKTAYNNDLQGPRDMAKAILPEIQSQEVPSRPAATAFKSGDRLYSGISSGLM